MRLETLPIQPMYQDQSFAKGRGTEENRIATDIAKGKINGNEFIIQGITQDNTSSIQKVPSIYLCSYGSPNPQAIFTKHAAISNPSTSTNLCSSFCLLVISTIVVVLDC